VESKSIDVSGSKFGFDLGCLDRSRLSRFGLGRRKKRKMMAVLMEVEWNSVEWQLSQ
jgi:hypothetical protein